MLCKFLTYPEEIQKIFLFEQERQIGKRDVNVFLTDYATGRGNGGFSWNATLYSMSDKDLNKFRNAVSLRNKLPNNYDAIIKFYKEHVPDLVKEQTEIIKVDGITVIL